MMERGVNAKHHPLMPNSIIGILDLAAHGRSGRLQPDVVIPTSHRYGRVHIDAMGMPHVNHHYRQLGMALCQKAYLLGK
jgi:hypothetical protein